MHLTIVKVSYVSPNSQMPDIVTFYFSDDSEATRFTQQLPAGCTVASYKTDMILSFGASLATLHSLTNK